MFWITRAHRCSLLIVCLLLSSQVQAGPHHNHRHHKNADRKGGSGVSAPGRHALLKDVLQLKKDLGDISHHVDDLLKVIEGNSKHAHPSKSDQSTTSEPIVPPQPSTATLPEVSQTTISTKLATSTSTITITSTATKTRASATRSSVSQANSNVADSPAPSTAVSSKQFNPDAANNLAVYYGATPNTTATGLSTLCKNPNVDIVILAFLYEFFGPGGYPSIAFGPGCQGQTPMQAQMAPGLQDCTLLGQQITKCQANGKKVLVSLGGATSSSNFANATQARAFASTLWNLFGAGTGLSPQLRPFGSAVVDGFDIDNEDNNPGYYAYLVAGLRKQFAQDTSKRYYVSAAPQCPYPDASVPLSAMHLADFVWVQFYNNYCNLGTSYFLNIFKTWSNDFANSTPQPGPKIYIGGAASPGSAGSGYIAPENLGAIIATAKNLHVSNLGGMMLWDGTNALTNLNSQGQNYLAVAKAAIS